jgi:hypothetical protein
VALRWCEVPDRSGSPVLTGDSRGGQGRLVVADGELSRARAAVVRHHDSGGG